MSKTFYVCVIRYFKSRDIRTIYNLMLKGKIPLFLKALRCSNFNEMRWKCFWHYSFSVEIHRLNEYKTYFRSLLKCEDVKCCPKEILNITEENSDIDYEGMILSHQNHEKEWKESTYSIMVWNSKRFYHIESIFWYHLENSL